MTGKTRDDLDRSAHAVYSLHYHIIFVREIRSVGSNPTQRIH